MDPDLLATHQSRRRFGGDVRRAVAALKFALDHPLVDVDEGMRRAPHHLAPTALTVARQRRKPSQVRNDGLGTLVLVGKLAF